MEKSKIKVMVTKKHPTKLFEKWVLFARTCTELYPEITLSELNEELEVWKKTQGLSDKYRISQWKTTKGAEVISMQYGLDGMANVTIMEVQP